MNIIEEIEREKNIKLSDSQLKACQCAISEGIKVITGGPGTGKTTFIDVLIRYFEKLDYKIKISLSAPTGRAAQNLAAKTNHVAQTTHKMMGLRPYQNKDEKVLKVTKKWKIMSILLMKHQCLIWNWQISCFRHSQAIQLLYL